MEGTRVPSRPTQVMVDHSWARSIRQHLAAQLREAGRVEAKHVDALAAEAMAVFGAVLRHSSRQAWLHLVGVLQLLTPFRKLLSGRAELLPYLEGLYYQFRSSQALVSDLDVLGAIGQAFPEERSVLQAPPRASCPRKPTAPAKLLPSGPLPVFATLPCPFTASWVMEEASGVMQLDPVSLHELQRCVGPVGSEVAQEETPWVSSLGLMPLALATDVPAAFPCSEAGGAAEPSLEPDRATSAPAPVPTPKEAPADEGPPVTGLQAAEVFVRNRHAGKIKFLYLNVAPNRHFRPYDLVAIPKQLIDPHHYVFSALGVLHVHPEEGAEALSLGDWHREAVLWQLLQYIPFFRHFLVRKAFARWCCSVKHLQYLRRRDMVRSQILQAVPHFGAALLHISRLLQELRSIHWLPTDNSRCYDFPELKRALAQENSHAQGLLSRFLMLCSSILELTRIIYSAFCHVIRKDIVGDFVQRLAEKGARFVRGVP